MAGRRRRQGAGRAALACVTAFAALTGAALAGAAPADAVQKGRRVAPGVTYEEFDIKAAKGVTHAHLLRVDLGNPKVRVDLLYPGAVASRARISAMADTQGAVAGVNGDFFNITETQHPGVEATGASVGPAIAAGRTLKAAVPKGQRFGPALPPGTTTEDVFGVGTDGRARLDRLALAGSVRTAEAELPLGGLNQYALPVGSVGAFTSEWGNVSRVRATCGTDTDRAAPCSTDTYEVTVHDGKVVSAADAPGSGPIASGTTVLVGREAGAQQLRKFSTGESVEIEHSLVAATDGVAYLLALGGYPVLSGGQPLPGLDNTTSTVRTAVGIADGRRRVLLLALDGAAAYRSGLTIAEVAGTMRKLGSEDAFSLDGGGSSTLVARKTGASTVSVRNHPSGGAERLVPNGIGVFSG
ncbi:phosphodiester glycosidase family protein [Streptomyces sp. WAC04114]|uniref:phosphodiester glycosidase family protein n=1 Tax=Streptomyces sp. WAC04114 TaxID=2867961 RepID=UPI001C8B8537|nr:phosphodiester glycosidase family protein [Streptomyces sp. WAC04114]MBX9364857.1 phosphodiester glycosidase family protein [Streptomyces sp. WAC04114]